MKDVSESRNGRARRIVKARAPKHPRCFFPSHEHATRTRLREMGTRSCEGVLRCLGVPYVLANGPIRMRAADACVERLTVGGFLALVTFSHRRVRLPVFSVLRRTAATRFTFSMTSDETSAPVRWE